jgi:pSer/pThr/pTyr-binding forkhead associated (FHA) protein
MANPSVSARITIITGPNAGNEIQLIQREQTIGRNPNVDIVIAQPEVSSRHARVTYQDDKYFIEDLKSSNGTFVNGQQVHGPVALKDDDEIALGPNVRLRFGLSKVQSVLDIIAERTPEAQDHAGY